MSRIILPAPHPGQVYVREHPARFKFLCAGRRWRKTTLLMTMAVEAALAGKQVLWGAPTFSQTDIAWEEFRKACGDAVAFKVNRHQAIFPNSGVVTFRSLNNPDNARGYTMDLVILDECPLIPKDAWYEVIRPVISDTKGDAVLAGTPKGKNWYYGEWVAAKDDRQSVAWSIPSLGARVVNGELIRARHRLENPDLEFAEMVHMFRTMPEATFLQEILAKFVDDAGGIFKKVMEAATALEQVGKMSGHMYTAGIDWGTVNDWTVISVLDATTRQQACLERFQQQDYDLQITKLNDVLKRFKPAKIIAEVNSMGLPLVQQLIGDGWDVEPFYTTNPSKKLIIDALALAFEKKDIRILADQDQIAELQAYERINLESGFTRYQAPDRGHDDTVMALALAYKPLHDDGEPVDADTAAEFTGGTFYPSVYEEGLVYSG